MHYKAFFRSISMTLKEAARSSIFHESGNAVKTPKEVEEQHSGAVASLCRQGASESGPRPHTALASETRS